MKYDAKELLCLNVLSNFGSLAKESRPSFERQYKEFTVFSELIYKRIQAIVMNILIYIGTPCFIVLFFLPKITNNNLIIGLVNIFVGLIGFLYVRHLNKSKYHWKILFDNGFNDYQKICIDKKSAEELRVKLDCYSRLKSKRKRDSFEETAVLRWFKVERDAYIALLVKDSIWKKI